LSTILWLGEYITIKYSKKLNQKTSNSTPPPHQ
jgi:hypothetical protein